MQGRQAIEGKVPKTYDLMQTFDHPENLILGVASLVIIIIQYLMHIHR